MAGQTGSDDTKPEAFEDTARGNNGGSSDSIWSTEAQAGNTNEERPSHHGSNDATPARSSSTQGGAMLERWLLEEKKDGPWTAEGVKDDPKV